MGSGRRRRGSEAPRLDRGRRRSRDPLVDDIVALRDELHADGVNHFVLGGMGGSSLAPEVITRTAGVELTVLDSTDPGQVLAALGDRLATHRARRLVEVGLDRRDRQPEARLREGVPRRGHRPDRAHRRRHRPRLAARRRPRAPTATACSTPTPTSAAATRRSPPSAWCRPASPASTSRSCSTRRRPSLLELAIDSADNPGLVLGAAIAGTEPLQGQARHRRRRHPHRRLRATGPSSSSPSRPASTARASCPSCSTRDSPELTEDLADLQIVRLVESARATPRRSTRARSRSAAPSARRSSSGSTRPPSPAACSASTRSTSPTSSRPRSPPAACSTPARSRRRPRSSTDGIEVRGTAGRHRPARPTSRRPSTRCSAQLGRRRLRRRSRPTSTASPIPQLAELRDAARRARRAPGHLRLGPALPALDRPVPQGRPRDRRVPADH